VSVVLSFCFFSFLPLLPSFLAVGQASDFAEIVVGIELERTTYKSDLPLFGIVFSVFRLERCFFPTGLSCFVFSPGVALIFLLLWRKPVRIASFSYKKPASRPTLSSPLKVRRRA